MTPSRPHPVTADTYSAILRDMPKGIRGRRHLEALARLKRTQQIAQEMAFEAEMQRALEDELRLFAHTLNDPALGMV